MTHPILTLVDGRYPLPPATGQHVALLAKLHAMETTWLGDNNLAHARTEKLMGEIARGKYDWTAAQADAVAALIGLDLGEMPENPDRDRLTTKAQWKLQDREWGALLNAVFARGVVIRILMVVLRTDPKLKARWKKKLRAVTDNWHRDELLEQTRSS